MKRIVAALLLTLMLAGIAAPASAQPDSFEETVNASVAGTSVSLTYTPSSPYASSVYYSRLRGVVLTGDQRTDIINVAMSQLGYHEGDQTSDLGGSNTSGNRNYTEYGYWFGLHVRGDSTGFYNEWCAMFVAWCARQARIPTSIINNAAYAHAGSNPYYFNVTYHARGTHTPKPGDLIFYDWAASERQWDHVGLVVSVKDGKVSAVEGNASEQVRIRTVSINNYEIQGYGVPNYKTGSGSGSGSSSNYPVPTRTLKYGMSGDDVKWLQASLKKLGYSVTATGYFGDVTKKHVVSFQKAKGLEQDGIVGPATRAKLQSALSSGSGSGSGSGSSTNYPVPTRTLKYGMRGDDVKWLQTALKELGYSVSATGYFGEVTKKHVISFQKSKGLVQDGMVGSATRGKLQKALSSGSGSGSGTGTGASTNYPVPTRTLVRGCKGDDVKWLQYSLTKLGYTLTVDGNFGPGTESKVKAFQGDSGLTVDGKVGPATRTAIKNKLG